MPGSWQTSLFLSHTSAVLQQSPSRRQIEIGCTHCKPCAMHSVLATMSSKCDEQSINVELFIYIILSSSISSPLHQIFKHAEIASSCSMGQYAHSVLDELKWLSVAWFKYHDDWNHNLHDLSCWHPCLSTQSSASLQQDPPFSQQQWVEFPSTEFRLLQ